jgi:SAM-dependent methyltransferase
MSSCSTQQISTADVASRTTTTSNNYSTERLAWRILWTRALPTAVQTLLQDDNDNDDVWYDLAFRCIWRDDNKSKYPDQQHRNTPPDRCSDSLGYGEITEIAVFEILHVIRQQQQLSNTINVVVDLGSGTGRVVAAAAIALRPALAMGLEIVPELHQRAVNLQTRWNDERSIHLENMTTLDFRCCDFTVDTEWIDAAHLIFMHCTVFEEALFAKVCDLCAKVNAGTWIVTVSRPLLCRQDAFECVSELQVEMSWGRGLVYLQRKR